MQESHRTVPSYIETVDDWSHDMDAYIVLKEILLSQDPGAELVIVARHIANNLYFDEAKILLTELISRTHSARGYYMRGVVLTKVGKHMEAIEDFERATVIQPNYFSAHYRIASVLNKLGKPEEAKEAFKRGRLAQRMKAVETEVESAEGRFQMGMVLRDSGDFAGAEAAFRAAVEAEPDFALAHSHRANMLAKLGRHIEALEANRVAVQLNPNSANLRFGLAQALRYTGDLTNAVTLYREVLALNPSPQLTHLAQERLAMVEAEVARQTAERANH
jgi:tetratricopeptide (TPR) repeat protein